MTSPVPLRRCFDSETGEFVGIDRWLGGAASNSCKSKNNGGRSCKRHGLTERADSDDVFAAIQRAGSTQYECAKGFGVIHDGVNALVAALQCAA